VDDLLEIIPVHDYLEASYDKFHEMKTQLKENQANLTALLCTTVYYRDKAD